MRIRWTVAALAVSLASTASPAAAQERERPRFGFGAGVDASFDGGSGAAPAYVALASVAWQKRGSGLGVRSELLYRRTEDRFAGADACGTQCPSAIRGNLFGAALTATYELRRGSLFRPYVLSGAGIFVNRATASYDGSCAELPPGEVCTAVAAPPVTSTDVGMGLVSGVGISVPAGRLRVYTEARLQALAAPARSSMIPVVLGIRF